MPLVVPEVNEADLEGHAGIVANPNCVAAPLVVALKPIADAVGLERVIVSSYQSVSGTGQAAVTELREQSAGYLAGDEPEPAVYPHPIAFNAMPHIGDFGEDGYTGEERRSPTRPARCSACPTCRSAPPACACRCSTPTPRRCTSRPPSSITADAARNLLMVAPGVVLVDEPALSRYPLARDAAGRDEVFVGRIREDSSHPSGAGAVGRERQPAQGRRHQRGPDRRVAGHPGLALETRGSPGVMRRTACHSLEPRPPSKLRTRPHGLAAVASFSAARARLGDIQARGARQHLEPARQDGVSGWRHTRHPETPITARCPLGHTSSRGTSSRTSSERHRPTQPTTRSGTTSASLGRHEGRRPSTVGCQSGADPRCQMVGAQDVGCRRRPCRSVSGTASATQRTRRTVVPGRAAGSAERPRSARRRRKLQHACPGSGDDGRCPRCSANVFSPVAGPEPQRIAHRLSGRVTSALARHPR